MINEPDGAANGCALPPEKPARGRHVSHLRFGKPWPGVCANAAQRWIFVGRKISAGLEVGLDHGEKIQIASGEDGAKRSQVCAVATADVHEFKRRSGSVVGRFFSDVAAEYFVGSR